MSNEDDPTLAPLTFGEALKQAKCPTCGAKPGIDCEDGGKPLSAGHHRVHTLRCFAPALTKRLPR